MPVKRTKHRKTATTLYLNKAKKKKRINGVEFKTRYNC
jgi:hypothetical protein